jgi:predicted ATPase
VIHVERPRLPPTELVARSEPAVDRVRRFFEGQEEVTKQQVKFVDFQFEPSVWLEARPALTELFHGKCAFCESDLVATGYVNISQFRPTRDALGLDGISSPTHYFWLAYEWENLYPICEVCDRNKRNLFPVAGTRAAPGAAGEELEKELRLLLDPCLDYPEEHLVFGDEGRVASVTLESDRSGPGNPPFDDHDRGTITIDTFGLNRDLLIRGRELAATETSTALDLARISAGGDRAKLEQSITALVDPARPYSMVRRQVAARWLKENDEINSIHATQLVQTDVAQQVQGSERSRQRAFKKLDRHEAKQASASIKDTATFARTTRISHVRIENFRGIEELEFEIPTTSWKMLIGENGTGKSSILQAVAIALMGRQQANRLKQLGDLDPEKLIRRGTSSARIVVLQAASTEPIEVAITRRGIEYPRGRAHQKAVLLGFGSARWLPRPRTMPPETDEWIRVRNLVNPFVPLCDANKWLRELRPGTNRFRAAEGVIKALLRLAQTTRLRVIENELRVEEQGRSRSRWLTLDQLSDGYQSALAMAAGIMGPLFSKWDVMREAEGVVLVDELDAHLHPRWKMRIVGDLRAAFPKVQFLASTHEPLCLRGLLEKEILLLRKDEDNELVWTDDLPSTRNMRVDQLLTSRFFGLHSTLDPDTERDLQHYYDLLALDRRTPEQEAELAELRTRVAHEDVLGDTPREQALYAVVDAYIAKELRRDAPEPAKLQPETGERIAEIWRDSIVADADVEQALSEILKS